jgi:hypothetical protein
LDMGEGQGEGAGSFPCSGTPRVFIQIPLASPGFPHLSIGHNVSAVSPKSQR